MSEPQNLEIEEMHHPPMSSQHVMNQSRAMKMSKPETIDKEGESE